MSKRTATISLHSVPITSKLRVKLWTYQPSISHCGGYMAAWWWEFWLKKKKEEKLLSQPGARPVWLAQIICRFVIVINLQLSTVSHFYLSLQSIFQYLSLVYCLAQQTNVFPLGEEQSTSFTSVHLFPTSLLIRYNSVRECRVHHRDECFMKYTESWLVSVYA